MELKRHCLKIKQEKVFLYILIMDNSKILKHIKLFNIYQVNLIFTFISLGRFTQSRIILY